MRGEGRSGAARSRVLAIAIAIAAAVASAAGAEDEGTVTCLGRIEPSDGVIRLAGPSGPGAVIAELVADEGDWVEAGDVVARLDDHPLRQAEVARMSAELERAERELGRTQSLSRSSATSKAKLDTAEIAVKTARADLSAARARLALSTVRSPVRAQVLEVHARPGERVGPEGIVELASTDRMYAIGEVYETDVGRVAIGQKARITSPALPATLTGEVERVGLKVGKMDVLGTDPVAKADARVVEVHILLDDAQAVAALTNLQVEIAIEP